MSNYNDKHVSRHDKLYEALMHLVDAMIVRDSGSWSPGSDAQEIVQHQVGVAWEKVYNHLREIEREAKAKAEANTLEEVMSYITEVKGVTFDAADRMKLEQRVSEENPYWSQF